MRLEETIWNWGGLAKNGIADLHSLPSIEAERATQVSSGERALGVYVQGAAPIAQESRKRTDSLERNIYDSLYQRELKIRAAGTMDTVHFSIHFTNAGKSAQPDIACWKCSVTPASVS